MKKIILDLTKDEAIVLFDWIKHFNKNDNNVFGDQAEVRILWDIESMLEEKLEEPLDGNYQNLLESARNNVRDSND